MWQMFAEHGDTNPYDNVRNASITHGDFCMSFSEFVIRSVITLYFIGFSWGIGNIVQGVWSPDRLPSYARPPVHPIFIFFGIVGLGGLSVGMSIFTVAIFLTLLPIGYKGALAIGLATLLLVSIVPAYWMKKTYFNSAPDNV